MIEALRPWSTGPEEGVEEVLPLTMVGAPPTAGTAGVMGSLPFTAETDSALTCCAGPEAPAGTEEEVEVYVADAGEDCFLVALA